MASPTACTIDATGIHVPSYADILSYLQGQYQQIYGSDVYLGNDSQDGQLLAIFAAAINDANAATVAVYNSFSPATAQGAGLSSVVKINGLVRKSATYSMCDVLIVGNAGTTITNGIVSDDNQNKWNLPATVVIPSSGQITVTATAQAIGDIVATTGQINKIQTPTRGWQSVTNPSPATPGAPIETDAQLRARQALSTMLPSLTAFDGMVGAVSQVPGVTRYQGYENDTDLTDSNGIPSHSLAFVVEGGNDASIAQAIASKKTPGAGTYGTTQVTLADAYGIPHTIRFFRPIPVAINVAINIIPLVGYTTSVGDDVVNAIVDYINNSAIGETVSYSKLFVPANLTGSEASTFNIKSLQIARNNGTLQSQDVPLAFNEVAAITSANVNLSVG